MHLLFEVCLGRFSRDFHLSVHRVSELPAVFSLSPHSVLLKFPQLLLGARIVFEISLVLFRDP